MLICDSSSLISLTDAGLLGCLITLKRKNKISIFLTPYVVIESIERPLKIPAYSFSAVRLKRALEKKVFSIIEPKKEKVEEILTYFNSVLMSNGKPMHLIHYGEAELLAAAVEREINYVLIDERTTRTIVEDLEGLRRHLQDELNIKISINKFAAEKIKEITKNINFIRSCEIVALAYETGYFKKFENLEKEAFKAALYATKFSGCAVSFEEIEETLKSV